MTRGERWPDRRTSGRSSTAEHPLLRLPAVGDDVAMSKPFQFALRRLFVATTLILIAVGIAALTDLRTTFAFQKAPPMSMLNVIEALGSFPLVFAGL